MEVKMESAYSNVKYAWAEYEFICIQIKNCILEMITEGREIEGYIDISIKNAGIYITLENVDLSISTLQKISSYLGVDGKVSSTGSKKHSRVKIIFEDVDEKE